MLPVTGGLQFLCCMHIAEACLAPSCFWSCGGLAWDVGRGGGRLSERDASSVVFSGDQNSLFVQKDETCYEISFDLSETS